jgi:LCP family protein required for cell wall assembly
MLSLPRDTVNVPLPRDWRAYGFYGGVYPAKINSLWARARGQANLFPGSKSRERGFNAIKGALGELYQIDIPYYIEVDFNGFKKIVDTFGGVAIDVQLPVADDHYPIGGGNSYNLYIPSGFQHMDGTQALAYARARHKTSDFDRAQRQQRVITSLRQQVDPTSLLEPGPLEELVSTLKSSIHTDIPAELFPALVGLAGQVDAKEVRSLVFTPPTYQVECLSCYSLTPKLKPIRRAVKNVFTVDKAYRTHTRVSWARRPRSCGSSTGRGPRARPPTSPTTSTTWAWTRPCRRPWWPRRPEHYTRPVVGLQRRRGRDDPDHRLARGRPWASRRCSSTIRW